MTSTQLAPGTATYTGSDLVLESGTYEFEFTVGSADITENDMICFEFGENILSE